PARHRAGFCFCGVSRPECSSDIVVRMRLRIAAVALPLLLSSTASLSQTPVRFELANGLRVWIQEDHRRPIVLVQTTYKFGSLNESAGQTGTAHYIEHM